MYSSTSGVAVAPSPKAAEAGPHPTATSTDAQPPSNSRPGVTDSYRTENSQLSSLLLSKAQQAAAEPTAPTPRVPTSPQQRPAADMAAVVHAKGHTCTLTYSAVKDTLRITRTASSGKIRTVLNIPMYLVINIETAAEREERQRARQANDETVKLVFAESSGDAGLLCAFQNGLPEGAESLVYAHSRQNTGASTSGMYNSGLFSQPHSPSAMSNQANSPVASGPMQIRYYVHYMRQRNSERPSIHTLEFLSHGPAEPLQVIVNTLVQRIYHKGAKHVLVFISPKSGKGKGERVLDKQVRPILHFSRHTYQVYVTQRAHDCEDYVADLHNPLNAGTVVAAVGGDGMIHEVVNGVQRRKTAFVRWLRSMSADVDPSALANADDGSQQLGDESSQSAGAATAPDAVPTKTPNTPERGDPAAMRGGAGAGGAAGNIYAAVEENKRSTTPAPTDAAAIGARELARRLIEEGWDALMPLVATVPTGSACGMAKTLNVLSVADAAMALVHLTTVHLDLLNFSFAPNKELVEYHRNKMTMKRLTAAKAGFAQYCEDNAAELQERAAVAAALQAEQSQTSLTLQRQQQEQQQNTSDNDDDDDVYPDATLSAADPTPPFLKKGGNVYEDEVSYALKMPSFTRRVAFMSLSFGAANDIDHGSESLRWMGNLRFHVYGGYVLLRGLRPYRGVLRYLPWESRAGKTVEKVHLRDKMPSAEDFTTCTKQDSCPHCQEYTYTHCGRASVAGSTATAEKHTGGTPNTASSEEAAPAGEGSAAATLAPYSDAELLDEDSVDFADTSLPWVTIRGEFCIALMCNVPDVAQDMLMAPLSHLSDGAIDIVYSRIDPCTKKGGRMEMLKFFMQLEKGKHVDLDFVNYVKARALEIKVDGGILMADGELMPMAAVRMTKLRSGVQVVRNEENKS